MVSSQDTNGAGARSGSLDRIKTIAAIVTALVGFVAAFTPVFGENGLVSALPLPSPYANLAGPLITAVSVVFAAYVLFIIMSSQGTLRARRTTAVLGLLAFVTAIGLLAMQLTWLGDDGVHPGFWVFPADVVHLLVAAVSIALLTSSLAAVAGLLAQLSNEATIDELPAVLPDEEVSVTRNRPQSPQGGRKPKATIPRTIVLANRVQQADWSAAKEQAANSPFFFFGRLYRNIALIVETDDYRARRSGMRRARFWMAMLSAAETLRPSWGNDHKLFRSYLLSTAHWILLWASQDTNAQEQLDSVEFPLKRPQAYGAIGALTLRFFNSARAPTAIGMHRKLVDSRSNFKDLDNLLSQIDQKDRDNLASAQADRVERRRLGDSIEKLSSFGQTAEVPGPVQVWDAYYFEALAPLMKRDTKALWHNSIEAANRLNDISKKTAVVQQISNLAAVYASHAYYIALATGYPDDSVNRVTALLSLLSEATRLDQPDRQKLADELSAAYREAKTAGDYPDSAVASVEDVIKSFGVPNR